LSGYTLKAKGLSSAEGLDCLLNTPDKSGMDFVGVETTLVHFSSILNQNLLSIRSTMHSQNALEACDCIGIGTDLGGVELTRNARC